MTEPIGDLINPGRFAEPPEVKVIQKFLHEHFNSEGHLTVQPNQIIIVVQGAALAGALRQRLYELQELCGTKRRLVIRIT